MEYVDEALGAIADSETRRIEDVVRGYTYFRDWDVLFAKITPCMENGKCAVATNLTNGVGFGSTEFHVVRPGRDVLPQWIFYFLRQQATRQDAARHMTGTAGQQRVPTRFLQEVEIPLQADRLRRLRRYALHLSNTYLQSVFLAMFGDPVTNPMGWEVWDLGEVLSVISGHGFKKAEYTANGVRLLQIANVSFQEIIWDALAYLPADYLERYPKLVLKPGDLLMALNRPILGRRVKFAVLRGDDCPAILYQRVGKFVITSDRLIQEYFYGFMLTDHFYEELKRRLAGSDQPYINPTELVKMRFMLPPLPLQQRFARIVHRFDRLRAQQHEAQRQAEHLFKTLLHQAFQGEL